MSLTDEQIDACVYKQCPDFDQWHEGPSIDDCRSIARATAAPLLEQIKELEAEVMRFREHALNEKAARQELEWQLEVARKDADRLEWIASHHRIMSLMADGNHEWAPRGMEVQRLKGPTFRDAVDSAISKEKTDGR